MKSGLDYFSLDVSLNDKFELIEAEFGLTGFAVVVKLFQKIYGTCGYYCEYTNEVALLFAKRIGLGGSVVSEIVTASIKRGIFDKEIFSKYQILTSTGIQERYFKAVSRRTEITVKKQYLLVNVAQFMKKADISIENVDISFGNDNISKQSKVEQSKEEYSRAEHIRAGENNFPQNLEDDIAKVISLYNSICTNLLKVKELSHASRERAIADLLLHHGKEEFETAFKKANSSTFLCGGGSKGWKATLDWILKPDRFNQILEGNFDNTQAPSGLMPTSYDIDEIDKFWDTVPGLV